MFEFVFFCFCFRAQARPLLAQAMEDGDFDTLVDPRLQRNYNAVEMSRMVTCAAACVRHSAWLRPRMSQVNLFFVYYFLNAFLEHKNVNLNRRS